MSAALAGFSLGLSLILAIGAQNAFVLKSGLTRQHVFAVVLTCALSDAILIAAGVTGFGALAEQVPWLEFAMRIFGAAFLIYYGIRNLIAAWKGGAAMDLAGGAPSLRSALLTCLALTWLNPHVYLDTVVLLGSIAAQFDNKLAFGLGACTASFVFFFSLGYGARFLAPLFRRPVSWRILDLLIACVMFAIAASLLWE